MIEDLGIGSAVLIAITFLFLFWLIRYAQGMKRGVEENRTNLEEDMRELEDAAKKLEADLENVYSKLDSKVDQTQLELKLEEIEKKRAEIIQGAIELKKKAQASVEIIAIFTLLLLPIVAGFIYAYSAMSDSMKFKADVALDRIASSAERLYVEGPGASAIIYVDLPAGIDYNSSYIGAKGGGEGRYLSLNVSGSESFRLLDANTSGRWQNTTGSKVSSGFNVINMTVNPSGCVIILPR